VSFTARHVSFEEIEGASVFALADEAGVAEPARAVIIQFGEEEEQDRALGMTGLHIELIPEGIQGYGLVDGIAGEGNRLTITFSGGRAPLVVECDPAASEGMDIASIIALLNKANGA